MKSIILLAAGNSNRLGGNAKKQFLKISGNYVFEISLRKFQKWLPNSVIYLVVPKEDERWVKETFENAMVKVLSGGISRTQSVQKTLEQISDKGQVLIHDAARPCITENLVSQVMMSIQKNGVGVPRISLYDAIRKISKQEDVSLNREDIFAMQTPQGFDIVKLKQAYAQNFEEAADDATIYQRAKNDLHYVDGDPQNVKITDETSWEMVKKLLA